MRARTTLALLLAVGAAAFAVLACGGRREEPKEERLLVLDGLEIKLADVQPYIDFMKSAVPEAGVNTCIQTVLEEHLIPLRVAQRAFPTERQAMKARADDLCKVATNVLELDQQTQYLPRAEKRRSRTTRLHLRLPVAIYALDVLKIGAVSPPLEMPEGWLVAGVCDVKESPALAVADEAEVLYVGFYTHPTGEWLNYYAAERARLADKATFVHPDYLYAMPTWIQLPKKTP